MEGPLLAWLGAMMESQLDYLCIPGKSPSLEPWTRVTCLWGSTNGLALLNGSCRPRSGRQVRARQTPPVKVRACGLCTASVRLHP